jgi:hydroxyacylglutathione hydrolase
LTDSEERFVSDILQGQPEPPRYFARMKRDNRMGPALLPDGRLPQPARIDADQLGSWVGQNDRVILDLRSDRVGFAARHVRGSLFAPMPGGKLSVAAGSYVDEASRILLVLEDESQLDEAVRELIRIGLDRVEAWIPADEAMSVAALVGSYPRISTRELQAGQQVLDVRGADEFSAGHVVGAKNIAYTRIAARLDEVPGASPLFIHCGSGLRAAIAAAYLANQGREVVHVDGSFAEIPPSLRS